jgi:hypothetical protein
MENYKKSDPREIYAEAYIEYIAKDAHMMLDTL